MPGWKFSESIYSLILAELSAIKMNLAGVPFPSRTPSTLHLRRGATLRRIGGIATCIAVVLSLQIEQAGAGTPMARHRGYAVLYIEALFQRWFFMDWLGEPIVIASVLSCPQPQVERAVRDATSFPRSLATLGSGKDDWPYCRPTSTAFNDDRNLSVTLVAPKIATCSDYVRRWHAFVGSSSLEEAVRPYDVLDSTYDKYSIPSAVRTIERIKYDGTRGHSRTNSLETVARFRLIKTVERGRFCFVDFLHRDAAHDK
jgi:hypothetical protein